MSRDLQGSEPVGESTESPDEQLERAREIVLQQLSLRARTRSELAQVLQRKGIDPEVTDRLLDRFEEVGLVDDADFATGWVASRQQRRNLSRRALTQELRRKGVDTDTIAEAVEEVSTEDEYAAALDLAQRKLRSMSNLELPVIRRRLAGALARKGFGADTTRSAVAEALARRDSESDGSLVGSAGDEPVWEDDLP